MPRITRLGVARQATLAADLACEAAAKQKPEAQALLRQVSVWAGHAERQGWDDVAKHGQAQYARAARFLRSHPAD